MLYPVYIHIGNETTAHGMEFPDFPGCFSAADHWQDIPAMAREAIGCHLMGEVMPLPVPTPLEILAADKRYQNGVWLLLELFLDAELNPTVHPMPHMA